MKKKTIKIVTILLLAIMMFTVLSNCMYSEAKGDETKVGGVAISASTKDAADKIGNTGKTILGLIQVIGTIIAVAMLMILGIKYMMGSAEEKAEYKKTMLPYIIGAVLLFAAVNLASWIAGFASTLG